MPKKRGDRPPEKIMCANPEHGIPLRHEIIAEHWRLGADDKPAEQVHYQWEIAAPHGRFHCPACGHDTVRHSGKETQP